MERMVPSRMCIIIPPSPFLLDQRVFMTLGPLRIAAVLEQAGCHVEVMDLSGISNFSAAVRDHAMDSESPYFALTATTPQMPYITEIARVIREVSPNSRLILGGPHATLVHAAYKQELQRESSWHRARGALEQLQHMVDVIVAGDGEEAIFFACHGLSPALIDADDPASPLFLDNKRLTELPFPARHLVDVASYHYQIEGHPALSLIAQLGCPFGCGFCGGRSSPMLRRVRMRSAQNIVDEMEHIWRMTGRTGFMLYDDELNVNRDMIPLMRLIADTQERLGVEWRLRGFIKAQLFTAEQAKAMHQAGFRWILVGFESGDPGILLAINKRSTREENTRCLEIARNHGLKVKALMSIGHPGESEETVLKTRDWLIKVSPDDFDVSVITCYPGTPYYDEAIPLSATPGHWVYTYQPTKAHLFQIAIDYTQTADYYKGDPNGGYEAYVYTDYLSPKDIVTLRDAMERDIRATLDIPFNPAAAALLYEHSMGQGNILPQHILRISA